MVELFASHIPNVISIGASCRARFQIERYLKAAHPGISYPAFFWDWLWFGAVDGVIWTLENDFRLSPAWFSAFCVSSGKYQLQHRPSGLIFLHDFGEHESEAAASQALEARWGQFSGKYAFLAARTKAFISLKTMPLIFVYQGDLRLDHAQHLRGLLNIGGGGGNILVNVLQVGEQSDIQNDGGFATCYVDDGGSGKPSHQLWEGCDTSWDKVFDSFAQKPDFITATDVF